MLGEESPDFGLEPLTHQLSSSSSSRTRSPICRAIPILIPQSSQKQHAESSPPLAFLPLGSRALILHPQSALPSNPSSPNRPPRTIANTIPLLLPPPRASQPDLHTHARPLQAPLPSPPFAPPPYKTYLTASHTHFPTTLFHLSRAFTAEFSTTLYSHLTLTLHVCTPALPADTMRKLLQTHRLRKLRICLNMADMIDATGTTWPYGFAVLLGLVLPVEESVFALPAHVNTMMALEEVGVEIEALGEEEELERGYWVRYWDGSDVRREAREVRSALVRGLRVHGKRVHVGGMCGGCREALERELGVEVEAVGAVEVGREGGGRMLARDTTPVWADGVGKRERGGWV
ncbi:switch 2 [Physcia stellaris]|nr:switch 2 [Physcia stellaris]